jgi:hypothetical protein
MKAIKKAANLCTLALLALAAEASSAGASELYLLGGAMQSSDPTETSYSWQLEYRQDILKHLGGGISYLNEGHIQDHHRDGYTAQLWARTELMDYRLTLAAAAGPYFYLDTAKSSAPNSFTDDHGWKGMISVAAAYHMENDLILELRSNWVKGGSGFDSASILAGVGYHFEPDLEPLKGAAAAHDQELKNEVTLFMGQTIVNSFDAQRSFAAALEYRRWLSRHFDWTFSGLYEGDNRLVRRDGVMSQLWVTQPLLENALAVGAGVGAYVNISHYDSPFNGWNSDKIVSGIVTLSGSYRFAPHFALRASWNRIVTSYDSDTDVILFGLGYRF